MRSAKYEYRASWDDDMIDFLSLVESRSSSSDPEEPFWECLDRVVAATKGEGAFLDAGCGMGRVTLRYGDKFAHATASDPDQKRLDITRESAQNAGLSVRFEHCFAQDIPIAPNSSATSGGGYKLIVCSHVIQHTSTRVTVQILNALQALLADDGVFVCATTHCPSETIGFERHTSDSQVAISQQEFDELVSTEQGEALGVRWYGQSQLGGILEDAGFDVEEWCGYTFYTAEAVRRQRYHPLLLALSQQTQLLLDSPVSQVAVCRRRRRASPPPRAKL